MKGGRGDTRWIRLVFFGELKEIVEDQSSAHSHFIREIGLGQNKLKGWPELVKLNRNYRLKYLIGS